MDLAGKLNNSFFQTLSILPSNFEEVATGVLKVLNNMACLDITLLQHMLVSALHEKKDRCYQ
jgi:hypothetical protein